MKRYVTLIICCIFCTVRLFAYENDELRNQETDSREGIGSADAATRSISMSMVGWGVGLTAAIAALTILVPESSHSHGD